MRKANVMTVALIIYLGVIAVIAYPRYLENEEWFKYTAIILGQLVIIFLLRFFTIKRDKMLKNQSEIKLNKRPEK